MKIITDWLDVTYSPTDAPFDELEKFLLSSTAEKRNSHDDSVSLWSLGGGVLKLSKSWRFARASASGAVLSELRSLGLFDDYLYTLSLSPHNVTRLDAALDVSRDFPPIMAELDALYPSGRVPLTRKGIKITRFLETRLDGLQSGTWYAGHKSDAKVSGRVYDKRLERIARGVDPSTLPQSWSRYELTFRREVGCSLRDASDPSRLFWSYASTLGLTKPENVLGWSSGCLGSWEYTPPERCEAERLKFMIEDSAHLKAIFDAADRANCQEWVRALLLRAHAKRFPDSSVIDESKTGT